MPVALRTAYRDTN